MDVVLLAVLKKAKCHTLCSERKWRTLAADMFAVCFKLRMQPHATECTCLHQDNWSTSHDTWGIIKGADRQRGSWSFFSTIVWLPFKMEVRKIAPHGFAIITPYASTSHICIPCVRCFLARKKKGHKIRMAMRLCTKFICACVSCSKDVPGLSYYSCQPDYSAFLEYLINKFCLQACWPSSVTGVALCHKSVCLNVREWWIKVRSLEVQCQTSWNTWKTVAGILYSVQNWLLFSLIIRRAIVIFPEDLFFWQVLWEENQMVTPVKRSFIG